MSKVTADELNSIAILLLAIGVLLFSFDQFSVKRRVKVLEQEYYNTITYESLDSIVQNEVSKQLTEIYD